MRSFLLGIALCVATTVGLPSPAQAAINFSYMFTPGNSFTAVFNGSFLADAETFSISSVESISVNGNNYAFDTVSLYSNDGFLDASATPRLKLDGTLLDFNIVATSGGQTDAAMFSVGNQYSSTVLGGNSLAAATGGFTGGGSSLGAFIPARFSAAVSNAPEPDTWALMILGFGLAGAALRHQQQQRTRRNASHVLA